MSRHPISALSLTHFRNFLGSETGGESDGDDKSAVCEVIGECANVGRRCFDFLVFLEILLSLPAGAGEGVAGGASARHRLRDEQRYFGYSPRVLSVALEPLSIVLKTCMF